MTDRNRTSGFDDVLNSLFADPTRSDQEIAEELDSYRQKIWRIRKKLEDSNTIWGYTTIIDDTKLNSYLYIILLKMKPITKKMADLIIKRIESIPQKLDVRLINTLVVHGVFDLLVMFACENHVLARRYFDSIRSEYQEWLLEKPLILNVDFSIMREGKINPNLNELYSLIPK